MAREAAGNAGGSSGVAAAAAGEYWSQALKSFLDHIPVSSITGALQPSASPAVEIKLGGCVRDAIDSMYRSNAAGAMIVDDVQTSFGKFVDRDIGFVEFSSLVLWALEELEKVGTEPEDKNSDFLTSLKQHPQISETKCRKPVSVYSNQTVADALHILSKEKIGLAVIDRKTSCLIGSIQCRDLYLLLDDSSLFRNRNTKC